MPVKILALVITFLTCFYTETASSISSDLSMETGIYSNESYGFVEPSYESFDEMTASETAVDLDIWPIENDWFYSNFFDYLNITWWQTEFWEYFQSWAYWESEQGLDTETETDLEYSDGEEFFVTFNEQPLLPKKTWRPFGSRELYLENAGNTRRVIIRSQVVLTGGALEVLLTPKGGKEHESIFNTKAQGKLLNVLLIALGVQKNQKLSIELVYEKGGKVISEDAKQWMTFKKEFSWIYRGSYLVENPLEKDGPRLYAADIQKTFISVSNFASSIIDVDIDSSKDNKQLLFSAKKGAIPAIGTTVYIVIEKK